MCKRKRTNVCLGEHKAARDELDGGGTKNVLGKTERLDRGGHRQVVALQQAPLLCFAQGHLNQVPPPLGRGRRTGAPTGVSGFWRCFFLSFFKLNNNNNLIDNGW